MRMGVDLPIGTNVSAPTLFAPVRTPGPRGRLSLSLSLDFIYYTCTLLPMVWSLHPFHFWMNKIHADISPLPGHDGHDAPAGGSYFHHIHHAKYAE